MHIPILTKEISAFLIENDQKSLLIDCTIGFGGHSSEILKKSQNIKILGIDRDLDALNFCLEKFKALVFGDQIFEISNEIKLFEILNDFLNAKNDSSKNSSKRILLIHKNFGSTLKLLLKDLEKLRKLTICGILADLGVSSFQLDNKDRGFSFKSEKLDMRMDKTQDFNAKTILKEYSEIDLERIFREFGELKESKKLAKNIVKMRAISDITDINNFNSIIKSCSNFTKILPLCYQALRIEVNSELKELEDLLSFIKTIRSEEGIGSRLLSGAKIAILSFHSLEDRLVKNTFKELSNNCICDKNALKCTCGNKNARLKIITKKPITPKKKEIKNNPRSNCAKLRLSQII